MTAMNSKPPSSAVRATVARSAPRRAGPDPETGVVKSGICRPIFTVLPPAPTLSWRPAELIQGLERPQEHLTVGGRQHREDLLLPAAYPGLDGSSQLVAGRGEREQVHTAVSGVRLALD